MAANSVGTKRTITEVDANVLVVADQRWGLPHPFIVRRDGVLNVGVEAGGRLLAQVHIERRAVLR